VSSKPLVLVGTDGSKTSYHAVEEAARIAADKGGQLFIVSAYVEPSAHEQHEAEKEMGDMAYQMRGSNPAEEALAEAKERAENVTKDISIDTKAVKGGPLEVLGDIAKEKGADIVVVGNVGRRGLAGRLTGSVPEGIERHIPSSAELVVVNTKEDQD
jgi:nucleotide-binding universal stress UspA family protein